MNYIVKKMKHWVILLLPFTDGRPSCAEQERNTRSGLAQFRKVSCKITATSKPGVKPGLQQSLFPNTIVPYFKKLSCMRDNIPPLPPLSLLFSPSLPSLACWDGNLYFWPRSGRSCFGRPALRETNCFLLLKGNKMAVWYISTGKSLILGFVLLPVTRLITKGGSRDEEKGLEIDGKALQGWLLVSQPCPGHILFKLLFHVSHRSHTTLYSILGIQGMKSMSLNGADSCLMLEG